MLYVCVKYSMCDLFCDVMFETATFVKSMYRL